VHFYDLLLKIINGDPANVMIVFQPEFYGGKNENDKVYSVARERKVGRYVRIFPHGFKLDRTGRLCMKVEIYGNPYLREYCTCLSLLNTLCVSKICYSSPFLHFFFDMNHLLIMTAMPGELYWVHALPACVSHHRLRRWCHNTSHHLNNNNNRLCNQKKKKK